MLYKGAVAKKTFWGAYFKCYHIARQKIKKVLLIEMLLHIFFSPLLVLERIGRVFFNGNGKTERILIVEFFRLGDVVFATSLYNALKDKFPQSKIGLLGASQYADYFYNEFDFYYSLDAPWTLKKNKKNPIKKWIYFFYKILKIRIKTKFDIVIDSRCDLRSAMSSFFIGGRRRIGFKGQLGDFFFNELLDYGNLSTKNDDYIKIAKYLNANSDKCFPKLKVPTYSQLTSEEQTVFNYLIDKKFFIVHPGASWKYKKWGENNFKELSNKIIKETNLICIWINYDNSETEQEGFVYVQNPSFNFFKFLLHHGEFLICNNSGPLHVADAVECKTISFIGPSSDYWLPARYPYLHNVIRPPKVYKCMPCFETKCLFPKKTCLSTIKSDEVYEQMKTVLF